jgi:hypothetical protein
MRSTLISNLSLHPLWRVYKRLKGEMRCLICSSGAHMLLIEAANRRFCISPVGSGNSFYWSFGELLRSAITLHNKLGRESLETSFLISQKALWCNVFMKTTTSLKLLDLFQQNYDVNELCDGKCSTPISTSSSQNQNPLGDGRS